jgi:uncharacterized lipoprotein
MSTLLRTILLSTFVLGLAACSKEEAPAAPVEEVAPAAEAPAAEAPAAPAETAPATGGGYEPTPEERVPGITEPVADAAK